MSTTDPIVTHADLAALRGIRHAATSVDSWYPEGGVTPGPLALLDRLIAAAEADAPPLPEGWVVYTSPLGKRRILWHENGALHIYDDGRSNGGVDIDVEYNRDHLTPLRPTVTKAEVSEMAKSLGAALLDGHSDCASLLLALARGGIEVQP